MIKRQLKPGRYSLSREQVLELIAVSKNKRDALLITLMGCAGLRRDECTKILIKDIDTVYNRLMIRGKGNKYRQVPIDKILLHTLTDYLDYEKKKRIMELGYLFPSSYKSDKSINVFTVTRAVAYAGQRAGLTNPDPTKVYINPHILRHSYAHYLKQKGISLEIIRDILGHSSISTTADIYGLASIDEIQKQLESIH